jgi:hypothetical protein
VDFRAPPLANSFVIGTVSNKHTHQGHLKTEFLSKGVFHGHILVSSVNKHISHT